LYFVHKMQIALKEVRESYYWLRLLAKTEVVATERLTPLIDEWLQLRAILSKAVATAQGKQKIAAPRARRYRITFDFCHLPFAF